MSVGRQRAELVLCGKRTQRRVSLPILPLKQ